MTVDNIIALARTLTQTTTTQLDATIGVLFLNNVYHDVANRIISQVDEDYFWDTFTADTVQDQSEYPLPEADSTTAGIKKITRVELKYKSTDSYKTLLAPNTLRNYKSPEAYIEDNQSTTNAFYDIRDGSVFVYPEPDEAVTAGLKVSGTVTLIDLVSGGAESTVFPNNTELRDFHNLLAIGMKKHIYGLKGRVDKEGQAIQEYELEVSKLIKYLKNRNVEPVTSVLPSTNLGR